MADDLYGILDELRKIRELIERTGGANYSAPTNNPYVDEIMNNPVIQNIMKKDTKTGKYNDTGVLDFKTLQKSIDLFFTSRDLNNARTRAFTKTTVAGMKQDYDKLLSPAEQKAYLAASLDKMLKTAVKETLENPKSPLLNANSKKAQANPYAQKLIKDYAVQIQLLTGINSHFAKLMYFLDKDKSERKTLMSHFIEDLVDGLAKSKFVGGAISDSFKLLSFFVASWVKNIPIIGKPLAVLTVALGSLGQVIASAILNALTLKFLPSLMKHLLPKLGGGLFRGSIGRILTGVIGRGAASALGTAAATGTAGVTMIGGTMVTTSTASLGGAALGGTAAAAGAGGAAAGAGGAAAAAGGIGLAAILGWIVAAIAIIVGIVAIIKNWDKIMDTIKTGWETVTNTSFWQDTWEGLKNWWNTGDFNKVQTPEDAATPFIVKHPVLSAMLPGVGIAGTLNDIWRNKGNKEGAPYPTRADKPVASSNYGRLVLDQGGVPMNLGTLDRNTASRGMEAYRRENKALFDAYYEIVPEGLASVQGSFKNDLKMKDMDRGNKLGAVLYRGASEDLLAARKMLVEAGMSPERAAMLAYTSGIGTGSSSHSKTGGHSNPLGYGFDLSTGKRWTKKDWDLALPILKQVWKQRGIDVFYEDERGHKFVSPTSENANFAHIHAQVAKEHMYGGTYADVRSGIWYEYVKGMKNAGDALKEQEQKVNEIKSEAQTIEVAPVEEAKEQPEVEVKVEGNSEKADDYGYTRIVQPDDSGIKSTIPQISKKPQIDYTGDEMFSDVLQRTLSVAMKDPVQQ